MLEKEREKMAVEGQRLQAEAERERLASQAAARAASEREKLAAESQAKVDAENARLKEQLLQMQQEWSRKLETGNAGTRNWDPGDHLRTRPGTAVGPIY